MREAVWQPCSGSVRQVVLTCSRGKLYIPIHRRSIECPQLTLTIRKLQASPSLQTLRFDNRFVRELPADPHVGPQRRQVHGALYSWVEPTPVSAPRLIAYSPEVAALLGIDEAAIASPEFAQVFGGNALLEGMQPYAANYGGHQFGHWAGQLGDGRAITLGETINAAGERWELQLKGAGPTPYARTADGRAVLRSSVREFLCSEAMHHLGVPTTRALSLVATGERGRARHVLRRPPQGRAGRDRVPGGAFVHPLRQLRAAGLARRRGPAEPADRLHHPARFPGAGSRGRESASEQLRAEWFGQVCERTARMIAHWMRVGFVHGVMNTDNMSILGLTIDYGPYGWIDDFDLDWTPNTTDAGQRRYRFGQQAQIAYWNLGQLANALAPAFASADPLHAGLQRYADTYLAAERGNIAAKLGLAECLDEDIELMQALYAAAAGSRGRHDALLPRAERRGPRRADLGAACPRLLRRGEAAAAPSRRSTTGWPAMPRACAAMRLPPDRAARTHACRQPPLRPAQLPRAAGDRPRRTGRRRRHP